MRRNFNLTRNPGAPIPIQPTTILRSVRSGGRVKRNGLFSSSKYSKFLVRNLSGDCQKEARQQLNDFINQRSQVSGTTVGSCKENNSVDLSLFIGDAFDEQHPLRSCDSSKCSTRTVDNRLQSKVSSVGNASNDELDFDNFVIPQIPISSKVVIGKRKHPPSVEDEDNFNTREAILQQNNDKSSKSVRFCDCCLKNSNKPVLKHIENKEPPEPFLEDSIRTPITEDFLCKEVSPVSKMLEKRKMQLNYGSLRLASQQKLKKKKEWSSDKLKKVSDNLSEAIPHLILSSEKPVTYKGELKSLMKRMFLDVNIPDSKSNKLVRMPSDDISDQIKDFFNSTSPFISFSGKASKSCLEETVNFDFDVPSSPNKLDIDFEKEFSDIDVTANFLDSANFSD